MKSDLLSVISLVRGEMDRWDERRQRHLQLLDALLRLAADDPLRAEEGFTTQELRDEVSRLINKPWGSDESQPKVVSQHWNKLETYWEKKREGLRQRAAAQKLSGFPVLRKTTGGGGGLPSRYSICVQVFEDEAPSESDVSFEGPDSVQYFLDDLETSGRLARVFVNQLELGGWRKWAFVSIFCVGLLAIFLFGLSAFFSLGQVQQAGRVAALILSVAAVVALAWKAAKPFIEILDLKIAVAPGWLQGSGALADRLFMFERRMPDAPNVIRLVRYTGTCPVCGGRIILGDGGPEFIE